MAAEVSAATPMASVPEVPEVREDREDQEAEAEVAVEVEVAVESRSRQNRTVSKNVPFDETQSNCVALNTLSVGGATKLDGAL